LFSNFHAQNFRHIEFPQILILSDVFDSKLKSFFELPSDLFLGTPQNCLKNKHGIASGITTLITGWQGTRRTDQPRRITADFTVLFLN